MSALRSLGKALARFLSKPRGGETRLATSRPDSLASAIRKGDVLLVEGNTRISAAIKYLTQSTWSHAALCVSDESDGGAGYSRLIEADIVDGVRIVPLSAYSPFHTRICRPVGLSLEEIQNVTEFALSRVGYRYDLRHILDLARYLIQIPPVPGRWRRRLLALGSGDPTRAICSSLIAQAFQQIRYPILPEILDELSDDPACETCFREIMHIRHHSLFVPRDFDISPYFEIVKPELSERFDFHRFTWLSDEHADT